MNITGAKRMGMAWDLSKVSKFSVALMGAAAFLVTGADGVKAETADDAAPLAPIFESAAPVAAADALVAAAVIAHVPLPLARPSRPQDVAHTGVDALAQKYVHFQSAVTEAIHSSLGTPREVRRMLDKLRFSEPGSVAQGWLAHRGLIAAQDPSFAAGVQRAVSEHGAAAVLAQLSGKGSYARSLPGADTAVAAVMSAIAEDNRQLSELHDHFLTAAYAFQTNRWGMIESPATVDKVDFADAGPSGDEAGIASHLASALDALSPISPAIASAPPLMERVLAYGARHVIATSLETEVRTSELAPPARRTTSCLNWAKLNLNQCIAAAHFPSEEAWCTGKHAIEDVRACWASVLPKADR